MSAPLNALQATAQLGYRNHVFISWPHKIEQQGITLVQQLAEDLADRFESHGGGEVYLDRKRLEEGYDWNAELRLQLCRSAVTIAVILPRFFQREYCRIEWQIAELMQERRRVPGQTAGYLIPVLLLAESEELPNEVKAIQYRSDAFFKLLRHGRTPRSHTRWRGLVSDLADLIRERLKLLTERAPEWEGDEQLALAAQPKEFTWPAPARPPAPPALPKFAVEKKLT